MIDVHCDHCGRRFDADPRVKGGITNCPHCGHATTVEGSRDPLWRLVQLLAIVGSIGVGIVVGGLQGPLVGAGAGLGAAGLAFLLFKIGG